jgi:uncharacterized membrane protein YqjE
LSGTDAGSGGLLTTLRRLGSTTLELVTTRLELLTVELRQEELRLFDALVLAVLACVLLGIGAVLLALIVVVLFWDAHRLLALSVLTLLFFGGGAGSLAVARRRLERSVPFRASLDELAADHDALEP